jgi:hypothetical protein
MLDNIYVYTQSVSLGCLCQYIMCGKSQSTHWEPYVGFMAVHCSKFLNVLSGVMFTFVQPYTYAGSFVSLLILLL